MAIEFTASQKEIIKARKQNIVVSAAAGSGKTAVLVQRIIDLICDPTELVDVDRILVVTFTEAAAGEMKLRVGKALEDRLALEYRLGSNNCLIEHLEKQRILIHRSFIMTIDAFCKFVLSNNFSEAGIDPGFRIMDEGEKFLMQTKLLEDMFEEYYQAEDRNFFDSIEAFDERGNDEKLKKLILDLYNTSESFPWPKKWLTDAQNNYQLFDHKLWLDKLFEEILINLAGIEGQMATAIRLCEEAEVDLMPWIEILKDDLTNYQRIKNKFKSNDNTRYRNEIAADSTISVEEQLATYDCLYQEINGLEFKTWSTKRIKHENKDIAKAIRDKCKDAIKKLQDRYFYLPRSTWQAQLESTGEKIANVIRITLEFSEKFSQNKLQENCLDFSDLEHLTLKVLLEDEDENRPSAVAKEYQQYFSEIMIDEYQDSNEVQEVMLKALCREHLSGSDKKYNRFMVGDVKQSIYRFRKADPRLIIDKMRRYSSNIDALERRIDLQENFRSRNEVLECVNDIFEKIMIPSVGGVEYDVKSRLNNGNKTFPADLNPVAYKPELHLLSMGDIKGEKFEYQMEMIARLILDNMTNTRLSDGVVNEETGLCGTRAARFSDVAILFRSLKGKEDTIKKVLNRHGIPVVINASGGYYEAMEVTIVLQFLRILDNPLQNIYFYGTCVSPLFGFCDATMAKIKINYPNEYIYDSFLEARDSYEEVDAFLKIYDELKSLARYATLEHLIETIYDKTGFLYYIEAMSDGEERRNNLELLLERAREFGKTNYSGIFNFILYIEKLIESQKDSVGGSSANESADAVRIYTMHKSKGLEFPICIVANVQSKFNNQDEKKEILLDDELGVACQYTDLTNRIKQDTLLRKVLSHKEKIDTLGESLRILYVALTRAKEKLIITGSISNPSASALKADPELTALEYFMSDWRKIWGYMSKKADYIDIEGCNSFLEMIMYGFERYSLYIHEHKAENLIEESVDETLELIEELNSEKALKVALELSQNSYAEFEANLEKPYEHSRLMGLYTKTSVSELKHEAMVEAETGEGPNWMFEEKMTKPKDEGPNKGALYGTAMHRVMELMDVAHGVDNLKKTGEAAAYEWLEKSLVEWQTQGRMTTEQVELVSKRKLITFLSSDVAQRMAKASENDKLYKEQPFFLGIAANERDEHFPEDELLLIQGIIDVYLEEEDGIVLLDYKTDNVGSGDELVKRYKTQIDYYARALEQGRGIKVKERILYSFKLEEEIVC